MADKLERENSQALAAGMSYGKWKAMQPIVPLSKEEPKWKYETKICAYCGAEFAADRNCRRYCGALCKKKAKKEANRLMYENKKKKEVEE